MNKELTPLQALYSINKKFVNKEWNNKPREIEESFNIIETALNDYFVYKQDYERVMKEKNSLLKECAKSQKKLKALEIIVEYDIRISDFRIFNTFASFNQRRSLTGLRTISKEKYDLLKEILL